MTYVELIVVLAIFAVMSSVVIFNYGDFQAQVDIKNLASDIALQIVQAQKSSLAGLLPTQIPTISPWKPSYGVYFNPVPYNKSFIYFVDLDQNDLLNDPSCPPGSECLNKIAITKNNSISSLSVFYQGDSAAYPLTDLTATFTRPNSGAIIRSSTTLNSNISHVQINITSLQGISAAIELYPSGRVQIN